MGERFGIVGLDSVAGVRPLVAAALPQFDALALERLPDGFLTHAEPLREGRETMPLGVERDHLRGIEAARHGSTLHTSRCR